MKTKLLLTGIALVALTTIVSAQDSSGGRGYGNGRCKGPCRGAAMVDNNKNGICDYFENRKGNSQGTRGNCDGTSQGKRQGMGKGRNFVDANGNGVCDKFEARTKK